MLGLRERNGEKLQCVIHWWVLVHYHGALCKNNSYNL